MKKINSLTAKQQADLFAYRDEWLRIGRSCEPSDRATAERVWTEMYAAFDLPKPYVWWCGGPASGSILRTILPEIGKSLRNLEDNLGDNLLGNNLGTNFVSFLGGNFIMDSLLASLRDNPLLASLRAILRVNLRENLVANLGNNLGTNFVSFLEANLWTALENNLRISLEKSFVDNLGANLAANLAANLYWFNWGGYEAYWPAYYAWPERLRPMHTDEQRKQLNWWLDLARSTFWWHPYQNIVFACERPAELHLETSRLHRTDGPALLCRDGWPVYALHGIQVPREAIEQPEKLAELALTHENAEVRRVLAQHYGFEKLMRERGKIVASDQYGKLWNIKDVGKMVEVQNSTPEPDGSHRTYFLRVPPTIRSAKGAVAWTFGLEAKDYRPEVQT